MTIKDLCKGVAFNNKRELTSERTNKTEWILKHAEWKSQTKDYMPYNWTCINFYKMETLVTASILKRVGIKVMVNSSLTVKDLIQMSHTSFQLTFYF